MPHGERAAACAAYIKLNEELRQALLSRVIIQPAASNIAQISNDIADALKAFPPEQRELIAHRLIEWWDLQVVHSFCGKRERVLSMLDVQLRLSEIAGELYRDEVLADFKIVMPPDDHSPPSLIAKQLQLVDATKTEIRIAEREEWRARSQRHKWLSERVDMATRISIYDLLLVEAWEDKHALMTEQTEIATDAQKRSAGLEIFRWSFNDAKAQIAPFANNWSADYYVRGCYQFLAVDLKVGWHPDFRALLRSEG
ncbi:ABC-three component system protein [Comamonas testosteroni]|uniref:ABC-three component system protein n=1 Tax=Comamonas testosteroni TaxID=285 RepID=UPI0015FAB4D3|nr:ABC-three component system protein [Comamonas testosteroni]